MSGSNQVYMEIHLSNQPPASPTDKAQPVVVRDRSRDALTAAVTRVAKQASQSSTTVTLSPEALQRASVGLDAGNPESVRKLLTNYHFRNVTPNALAKLATRLFEAGVISADDDLSLLGTEYSYEQTLDPNKPLDAVKVMDDRLNANMEAGPSAMAGRVGEIRALDLIQRLETFGRANRDGI